MDIATFDYEIMEDKARLLGGGGRKELLKHLKLAGDQGWEAVGITMADGVYTVLLKKALE